MATVPRQPTHSSEIQTVAAPAAIRPVAIAGEMMNASDWAKAESELARPRTRSSARVLRRGPRVGATKVSPSPNTAVNVNTQATRLAGGIGSAASPNTTQDAAQIRPTSARARLRRSRRTNRSTISCVATMKAVLTVTDSATMCADMCASTVA